MGGPVFKHDLKAPPWLAVAEEARARYGSVSPFRLGLIVGRRALDLPCPYTLPRSAELFRDGVTWGKRYATQATAQKEPDHG